MSIFTTVSRTAGRLAGDVQHSVRRARLEGERRVLQRQHRAALEALGHRVVELVRAGLLSEAEIGPQIANVESKLMEIDAKAIEMGALTDDGPSPTITS